MSRSFQEKSSWVTLATVVVVFGFYFAVSLPGATVDIRPHQVFRFTGFVVILAAIQVIGHVAIALHDRRTQTDERDRLIALRGTRNGAYVLSAGVFGALCVGLLVPGNFAFMHALLGAWVVAQLVETGSRLWLYRREA